MHERTWPELVARGSAAPLAGAFGGERQQRDAAFRDLLCFGDQRIQLLA
jgi:hypothetical protein